MAQLKDLHEFLVGAELQHYYNNFVKDLKVTTVPQIKYVGDDDLVGFGMSKPEIRRLRRFFNKEHPKGALGRLKKILAKSPQDTGPPPLDTQGQQLHMSSKSSGKYIIAEDAVTVHKTIGRGEFGVVQQGVWTGEFGEQVMVAVKCLSREKLQAQMSDFLQEAIVMHSLDHPHVVHLFGVVLVSDNIKLVTELAPLRSLLECLREGSLRCSFSVPLLCDLAIQIADGMSYLESRSLIHRDLAARNVLMFAKDKIKISDFGLSRALGMTRDYYRSTDGSTKLPVAWCAPESINFLKFTSASDVWSFAVTLWEMFSFGAQPWEGLTVEEIIRNMEEPACQRLNKPDHCPDDWYALMLKCWQIEEIDRPKFCDIFILLQQGKPSRVIATTNGSNGDYDSSYLVFRMNDIVTVLAKMPEDSPRSGLWKGLSDSGSRPAFFDPVHFSPYVEFADVPILRKTKANHSGSARVSLRNVGKLTPSMISSPQSDLRHIGHVGYDGAVFGDVSFIGDNYDKLPIKVENIGKSREDGGHRQLPASLPAATGSSVLSVEDRQLMSCTSNDFDSFGDFELPDFSGSFDLGDSLMDEVMKVLGSASGDNSVFDFGDLKPISMDTTDHISKDLHRMNTSTSTNQLKTNQPEYEDADQDEADDDDEDEDDNDEDEVEEGVVKQSNNSLFGSSSCSSSKDPLDDYNGLRKPDESSSDRHYQSSNYDQSSSEKSFKDYGSTDRSDEKKIAYKKSPFERDHKALDVVEPQHSSMSYAVASGSIKALSIVSSDRSDVAENQNDRRGLSSFPRESDNMNSPACSGVLSKNVASESRKLYDSCAPIIASEDASVVAESSDRKLQGSVTRVVRPLTQNIRTPQGIPGREIPSGKPLISPAAVVAPPDEGFDSNPLRRLRDSQAGFGRPMMTFRPVGSTGRVAVTHISSSDDSNKNNLNVNLSFFDKLKEQELQKLS